MLCTDYYGCCRLFQTTIKNFLSFPFQEHRSKPHPNDYTLTCCNIQVIQRYCTMLATATGNCDVTNVTYNANKYYVVT